MVNTPIERKPKPSPSDELVELRAPDPGWSGTAKFHPVDHANMIAELIKRGYVVVLSRG